MLFQSTHPLRGATRQAPRRIPYKSISIHAPLAGCDKEKKSDNASDTDFNPRTPCGVRLFENGHYLTAIQISIHAPLAGCDDACAGRRPHNRYFNPRTPCGVRRPVAGTLMAALPHFNPRTPCGVRQKLVADKAAVWTFQSTHPLRGATIYACSKSAAECISIHAPLAGCDAQSGDIRRTLPHFNPRTPCGVRPDGADLYGMRYNFNPRTPCGVRRRPHCAPPRTARFQSTHPLRGATCRRPLYGHPPIHFNPRTPCGVRPKKYAITPSPKPFQSTHPLRGATAHV